MINTNYSGYNYMNSVNSFYRYNYNRMTSQLSSFNTAGLDNNKSYVNNDAVQYLQSIQSGAKNMLESLKGLSDTSTFNKMYAVSSKNEYLSVNSKSEPTKNFQETSVNIVQTAASQVNKGLALRSDETYAGGTGIQQFEIEVDGNRHQVSFEVKAGDTNKDVQQKMANTINGKNLGITATVVQDTSKGTSILSVQSNNTGDDSRNVFSIRDMSGSLVASTGVGTVSQQARNAVYTINGGEEKTSRTNTVDLGEGVSVTLLKATEGQPVTVSAGVDRGYAVDQVKNLVSSYNEMLTASQKNGGSDRLYSDLTTAYRSYATSLERIGVTANKDGTLAVDSKKLEQASQDGRLESFFTQNNTSNFGFSNRLSTIANNVERSPSYYVNRAPSSTAQDFYQYYQDSTANDSGSYYDNIFNSQSFNFGTYNRYLNLGYLFDLFV